jgi:Transposase domain (DUF772)
MRCADRVDASRGSDVKYVLLFVEPEQYAKDLEAMDQADRDRAFMLVGQWLKAAALCCHLLSDGPVHAFIGRAPPALFPDEMFADLFRPGRGRPSAPADMVATMTVLQALEGRSDREACRASQTDIAWKAAAGRR